jgi:predicted signal transduction protein with EAL and GGDEF domain
MLDFVHRPQSPRLLIEPALLATEAPSIAVLRVRITRPQSFTDIIGPRYANAVLNVAIDRLKSALHGSDSLLRMDKDELAIVLNPMQSVAEAEEVANEMIDLLQRPYFCRGKSARLNVAVGIAVSPDDGTDVETLLYCAETALDFAEVSHASRSILYEHDLEAKTEARHALSGDLASAVESSQLHLYYQPQFSIDGTRVVGFQTSPQWKHPRHGWISPSNFLPLAEEIGVLQEIAAWALRTACIQAAALGPRLTISVATCPLQFTSGKILPSVAGALATTGLEPSKLALEIPEQVLLHESNALSSTIDSLHRLGVKLVLANVGSSFGALDLLNRFPFSSLTFEAALVGQSSRQRSIVRAAAMLAKEIGVSALAQGIETEADLSDAAADGCTSVQGPLLGNIVTASQMPAVAGYIAGQHGGEFVQ